MPSRARYSREIAAPKPPAIEERSWLIFTGYRHKRRSAEEIAEAFHLRPEQVLRIVEEVEAQLGGGLAARGIGLESPVEDLGLSVRTRNALRAVGCKTVEEALELDLSSTIRGLGRTTREELLTRLESAGFEHPAMESQPASEMQLIERRLERMQQRIERALGTVAQEVLLVRKKLHQTIAKKKVRKESGDRRGL
jgi:hypothetical protein